MKEFNKVLVPVDHSEAGRGALYYAVDLVRRDGGEILVLHVVTAVSSRPMDGLPGCGQPRRDPADEASDYLEELRPVLEGVASRCLLRYGNAASTIVRVAREESVDVIIMATSSRHTSLMKGRTTEQVTQYASVPVWVCAPHCWNHLLKRRALSAALLTTIGGQEDEAHRAALRDATGLVHIHAPALSRKGTADSIDSLPGEPLPRLG